MAPLCCPRSTAVKVVEWTQMPVMPILTGLHVQGPRTGIVRPAGHQPCACRHVPSYALFPASEEARAEAGLPLLEEILEQPRTIRGAAAAAAAAVAGGGAGGGGGGGDADTYQPLVLSDYSPLRLAFHDNDTAFMASQVGCVPIHSLHGLTRRPVVCLCHKIGHPHVLLHAAPVPGLLSPPRRPPARGATAIVSVPGPYFLHPHACR